MELVEDRGNIQIWRDAGTDEYVVYGVTQCGDPIAAPSLGMAMEIAG